MEGEEILMAEEAEILTEEVAEVIDMEVEEEEREEEDLVLA